jgi:Xaa-Pro aminopeptidase
LFENQISSNEPGLYFEDKYGIRLENDILTKHIKSNEYGDFMGFETLTLCPFDKDLIDKKFLNKDEIKFLNNYHKLVYKKINKYLNLEQKKWLKKITLEV